MVTAFTFATVVQVTAHNANINGNGYGITFGSGSVELTVINNPGNGQITLSYGLSQRTQIDLEIYNILGEKVISVVNATQDKGQYTFNIARTALENSSGMYIIKFKVDGETFTKRLTLY